MCSFLVVVEKRGWFVQQAAFCLVAPPPWALVLKMKKERKLAFEPPGRAEKGETRCLGACSRRFVQPAVKCGVLKRGCFCAASV